MIEPVRFSQPSQTTHQSPIQKGSVSFPIHERGEEIYRDTLVCGKRIRRGFVDKFLDLLSVCWNWVKENLLFLIFDSTEERQETLKNELGEYIKGYFDKVSKFSSENLEEMKKLFAGLDSELQTLIKNCIYEVVGEVYPHKGEQSLTKYVDSVIRNPYLVIKPEDLPEDKSEIRLMGEAIIRARMKFNEE